MPTQPVHPFDESVLRVLFEGDTYTRGASYARDGRVLQLEHLEEEQILHAVVLGSGGRRYQTSVGLDSDDPFGADCYCTCPVGIACKHAAAVMLAAGTGLAPAGRSTPTPAGPSTSAATRRVAGAVSPSADWERSLAALTEKTADVATGVPLGLQFEVAAVQGNAKAASPRVRLRPVMPGRNGNWVRSGVSWGQVRLDYGYSPFDSRHRLALRGLLAGHPGSSRSRYASYGYGPDEIVHLDEFGPALWTLLEQLVDAGVELVPSRQSDGPVMLSATPAVAVLDITGRDERELALCPRLTVGDRPVAPERVTYAGSPPHGIVVQDNGLLLARLERPVHNDVSALVRHPSGLRIPSGDLDRFLTHYYPRLQRAIPVTSSDASVQLPEITPPRLRLDLTYRDGHRVGVEWGFEYGVGDGVLSHPLGVEPPGGALDPVAERRLLQELDRADALMPPLWSGEPGRRRPLSPVILAGIDAVLFFQDVLPALLADERVVVHEHGERPDFRRAESAPLVTLSATDSTQAQDWFDLGVTVSVDGEQVPFDELFTALAQGQPRMLLPSGTWFSLDREELHQLRRLIEEARSLQEDESGPLRLSRYQTGLWEELRSLGVVQAQSERWATLVAGLVDVDGLEETPPPVGLAADLRPYQLDGYRWLSFLWEHELGGILADDMGLGKTVQTLAAICRARDTGRLDQPVLVVAPTSVVNNWATEASRFAPELRVATVTETDARRELPLADHVGEADVVITSYALFRIDYDSYAGLGWSALLLDEAQFVKNHQAKTYQCARRLPAPFKLAITGTPLENSLMDLWALLSIVAPGLFPNPQRFSGYYRKPIERGGDRALLASLRRRIRPLMRRRTKELVAAELPPKQEQVLQVELAPRHRKVYDTHLQRERQKVLGLIGDLDKNRFTIFKSLTALRQLSLDPGLVDAKYDGIRSSKADVFLEHLTEVVREGHRTLVFSQFTGFLRRIRARLDAEGIPYVYLDGRTRNRDKVISAFKDGDAPVFLISLKAGGFGLNLTEADYVFVLDPWWNPATEEQAVDRTHRIGQDKTVMVYRLVSAGTIEEKVMALKARKAELFRNVIDDGGLMSAPLSADDIRALLEP